MADIMSKKKRSEIMSRIRGADTKPEWVLRCALHRFGFRYRLRNKHLPGKPDLVFPKYKAVIFVHGCYWHRHAGCKRASTPKTNVDFWTAKFAGTVARDKRAIQDLQALGWRVLVLWECELINKTEETVSKAAQWIRQDENTDSQAPSGTYDIERRELLSVAEKKVQYRIKSLSGNTTMD